MTASARRAIASALRRGDRVEIAREQDGSVTALGVVDKTVAGVIKVRVGASTITFYRTGLERLSPRRVSRGLRIIAGVLPRGGLP